MFTLSGCKEIGIRKSEDRSKNSIPFLLQGDADGNSAQLDLASLGGVFIVLIGKTDL